MIKLFRKTRQNLLMENKTGKYLKYAIGEIILVVIGILIALSINNWNGQRKNNASENDILIGLENEFKFNLNAINYTLNRNKAVVNGCLEVTEIIRSNTLKNDSKKLDSLLYLIGSFSSFDAVRGVTDELLNSGKLHLIKNDSLKMFLTRWTGSLDDVDEDKEYRFESYNHSLIPFISKYFPLANGELTKNIMGMNDQKLIPNYKEQSPFEADYENLNLMEFENVIWFHKHNNDWVILMDDGIKKEIKTILKLINEEITND